MKTSKEKNSRDRLHFEEDVAERRKGFNKVDLPPYSNMRMGY